jgi:hypothetical protein
MPRKLVKVESADKSPEELAGRKEERAVRSLTHLPKEDEDEPIVVKNMKKEQKARNKRLFGGLNQYLDRAKTKIDE